MTYANTKTVRVAQRYGPMIAQMAAQGHAAGAIHRKLAECGVPLSRHSLKKVFGYCEIAVNGTIPQASAAREPSERDQEIVAARLTGLDYRTIGAQFGITGERVRQILNRWRPDLIGTEITAAARREARSKTCPECGTRFDPHTPKKVWCSNFCARQAQFPEPTALTMRIVNTAKALRGAGGTWAEVAAALGNMNHGQIHNCLWRYARRTGEDLSDLFTRPVAKARYRTLAAEGEA